MTHTWYNATKKDSLQGLVYDEITGENIAVTYKPENARLVAAAPDLYIALELLVRNHDEIPSMLTNYNWKIAREAIAKAVE
jgi:hypothetical protein